MIRPRRTLRRGEPSKAEKEQARIDCRKRAGACCEMLKITGSASPECRGQRVLPLLGNLLVRGHLHHLLPKGVYGWRESEETGQRHIWACPPCHRYVHDGGKPCPPK